MIRSLITAQLSVNDILWILTLFFVLPQLHRPFTNTQQVFIYFFLCSGVGAGGGCVEGRSPGPALSNQSASGREQEAAGEPPSQRVPRHRGRPGETGGCVICSGASQPEFDGERKCLGGVKMKKCLVTDPIHICLCRYWYLCHRQSSRVRLFTVTDLNLEKHVFVD